jgi:AcrR family transcriptional regulator
LNVFKTPAKAPETRAHILRTALALFRARGFDETTMRDIAAEASVALGATYYYFASKEAIVADYYDYVQSEHLARSRAGFAKAKNLQERLKAVIHTKLDILDHDRKLLSALFRYGGDPDHPLSWFGPQTRHHRELCMQVFAEAMQEEKLPADLEEVAPVGLWALHMGILLYFLYDDSPGARRTRKLADGAIELAVQAQKLIAFPLLRPVRKRVIELLRGAGLIPEIKTLEAGTNAQPV